MEPVYEQLANRIARVQRHLRKWARRIGTSCWRVYEKDLPDQPLIVDWYDGDAVVWALDRTRNETPEDEQRWLDAATAAVRAGLDLAPERLWLKRRARQEDRQHGGQYQPLDRRGVTREVVEHGLRFEINLSDYLDVGLFLDHRPLRMRVRGEVGGRAFLNLFCYTAAFTCHAAAGGARATTSVDLSNTYLDWAGRNLAANGVAVGDAHRLVRTDVLAWLEEAGRGRERWDLIVCDPPTFSNSAAMRGSFAVERDHPALIAACARLLAPGGTLYFSTNARAFRFADEALPGLACDDISAATIPEDFRNQRIHRCWRIRRSDDALR